MFVFMSFKHIIPSKISNMNVQQEGKDHHIGINFRDVDSENLHNDAISLIVLSFWFFYTLWECDKNQQECIYMQICDSQTSKNPRSWT